MTCEPFYRVPAAAAARYARLLEAADGLRAIDYSEIVVAYNERGDRHVAMAAWQDAYFAQLDEKHDLEQALELAARESGPAKFRLWALVRVLGESLAKAANSRGVSKSTAARAVRDVDNAVLDAFTERQMMAGYFEPEDRPTEPRPRVEVWRSPGDLD